MLQSGKLHEEQDLVKVPMSITYGIHRVQDELTAVILVATETKHGQLSTKTRTTYTTSRTHRRSRGTAFRVRVSPPLPPPYDLLFCSGHSLYTTVNA